MALAKWCRPRDILHDLALLDDLLDLSNQDGADAHYRWCQLHSPGQRHFRLTHSLCESESRCGSWSCLHSGLALSGHRQLRGSRILLMVRHDSYLYEDAQLTKKLVTEAARVTRAGIDVSIVLRQSYMYGFRILERGAGGSKHATARTWERTSIADRMDRY